MANAASWVCASSHALRGSSSAGPTGFFPGRGICFYYFLCPQNQHLPSTHHLVTAQGSETPPSVLWVSLKAESHSLPAEVTWNDLVVESSEQVGVSPAVSPLWENLEYNQPGAFTPQSP